MATRTPDWRILALQYRRALRLADTARIESRTHPRLNDDWHAHNEIVAQVQHYVIAPVRFAELRNEILCNVMAAPGNITRRATWPEDARKISRTRFGDVTRGSHFLEQMIPSSRCYG
jgi:hypothetical protein